VKQQHRLALISLALLAIFFAGFSFGLTRKRVVSKNESLPWRTYAVGNDTFIGFPGVIFFQPNSSQLTREGLKVLAVFKNWSSHSLRHTKLRIFAVAGNVPIRQYWWLKKTFDSNLEAQMNSRAAAIKEFLNLHTLGIDVSAADRDRCLVASEEIDIIDTSENYPNKIEFTQQVLIISVGQDGARSK